LDYKHGGNIYTLDNKENIIDFSSNINPLGPPPDFKEEILDACNIIEQYPDPNYTDMRKELEMLYGIDKDYFILGNGGIQVIHNVIEFLDFSKALIIVPTFVEYEKALRRYNKTFEYYYLKEKDQFILNSNELLSTDLSDIDLVILCTPNNPTGVYLEKKELIKIVANLKELEINVLIDEAFIDFLDDDMSMMDQVTIYNNLIITRSITKFFAVPGLRLGFLSTSNKKLLKNINQFRESWSVNIFANQLFLKLFKNNKYIEETKKFIVDEGDRLYNQLKEINALKVYKPSVNYVFFKSEADILWKEELLKYHILIRHCNNYVGLNEKFYRIAVKNKTQNNLLIEVMNKIMEAFNE
jgi:threonine-phosphate decarboxylase